MSDIKTADQQLPANSTLDIGTLDNALSQSNQTMQYEEIPLGHVVTRHGLQSLGGIPVKKTQQMLDRKKRQEESGYVPIQVPSVDNIHEQVQHTSTLSKFFNTVGFIIKKSTDVQPDLMEVFVNIYQAPIPNMVDGKAQPFDYDTATELIYIKAIFHELIVMHNRTHLIGRYNEIFQDGQFDTLQKKGHDVCIVPVEMSDEEKQAFVHEYQMRMRAEEVRKRLNAKRAKHVVGEIVGAQDKEGRWWMSRVLAVFSYLGQHMYYVEFLGWGEQFNEFIVSPFRIQWYNPKKHRYYRPAFARNMDPDCAADNLDNPADTDLPDEENDPAPTPVQQQEPAEYTPGP